MAILVVVAVAASLAGLLAVSWVVTATPDREPLLIGLCVAGGWAGVGLGFTVVTPASHFALVAAEAVAWAALGGGIVAVASGGMWAFHRRALWAAWAEALRHPGGWWPVRPAHALARRLDAAATAARTPAAPPEPERTPARAA